MKIIFLDIDGVLNCQTAYEEGECKYVGDLVSHQAFYSKSKALLNQLIVDTGAKIVISSSWRHSGIERMRKIWEEEKMSGEIIDVTMSFRMDLSDSKIGYSIPRGCEIEHWLKGKNFQRINWGREKQLEYLEKSKVKNYVILDDDSDMLYNQREHFVKCNAYRKGFDEECYNKAKSILNMDLVELYYKDQDI